MKKNMWILGFIALSLVFGAGAVILGGADSLFSSATVPTASEGVSKAPVIVIDPGHGGEDGGCSAADGTLEKDINLEMSKTLCSILTASGYPAVMTRSEDKMLYSMYGDMEDYTGKKKVFDLKNRLRFADESGAKAFLSIHMNKFPSGKYKGFQAYYSPAIGGSTALADMIQNKVKTCLQPENERLIKKAGTNIYILNRAKITSVLCECGFLSNAEETEKLKEPEYRKKLSLCITGAVMDWFCTESEKDKNM